MFSRPLQPKYTCKEWEPNLPPLCLPNPEYLAPEYILSVSCDSASDMYSLGVVMHAVFNEGKPVFQVNKHDIFKSFSRQLDQVGGGCAKCGSMMNDWMNSKDHKSFVKLEQFYFVSALMFSFSHAHLSGSCWHLLRFVILSSS